MAQRFELRFPLSDVQKWCDAYTYADDSEARAIGATAGRRGWYTRAEFLKVMLWKTQRTKSLCAQNPEAEVVRATRLALSTPDERQRMAALLGLRGVAYPTASTLVHFAHRDRYPILDVRALWSLGLAQAPQSYSFGFWWDYVLTCRSLATAAGIEMRTLDRALWQYSKRNQPRSRSRARAVEATDAWQSDVLVRNKSAEMRALFEKGKTVSEVAAAVGATYGFAHGVRRRWLEASSR